MASGNNIALEISALSKTFVTKKGRVEALKAISLQVREGEVFAYIGPNGSGKTTTLHILARILYEDSGTFSVLGKKPADKKYFENIAFLSGDSEYGWEEPGEEILKFYCRLGNVKSSYLSELIERFHMDHKLRQPWMEYSNGEKTRLRLIKALMRRPALLFLDEPSVGLDPDASVELRRELRSLANQGMTVFLTTHYMRDVEQLADTVCFIKEGRILETTPRAALGQDLEAHFIALFGDKG